MFGDKKVPAALGLMIPMVLRVCFLAALTVIDLESAGLRIR
jgi:hypothetical protein